MKLSNNFSEEEFACPCGYCILTTPNHKLVDKLQELRDMMGNPIKVTSGLRCKNYNTLIGGYPNSPHITGMAADITCKIPMAIFATVASTIFSRVGLYPDNNFIHVDICKPNPSEAWIRRNGVYTYYKTFKEALNNL